MPRCQRCSWRSQLYIVALVTPALRAAAAPVSSPALTSAIRRWFSGERAFVVRRPFLGAVRPRALSQLWTVLGLTPPSRAASDAVRSPPATARASRSRSIGCSLPASLRLRIASRRLSSFVPRNRWEGRQHFGVSQWWQTLDPVGIGPYANSHATRCAPVMWPPGRVSLPWFHRACPPLSEPVQSQQSPDVSTCVHRRSRRLR